MCVNFLSHNRTRAYMLVITIRVQMMTSRVFVKCLRVLRTQAARHEHSCTLLQSCAPSQCCAASLMHRRDQPKFFSRLRRRITQTPCVAAWRTYRSQAGLLRHTRTELCAISHKSSSSSDTIMEEEVSHEAQNSTSGNTLIGHSSRSSGGSCSTCRHGDTVDEEIDETEHVTIYTPPRTAEERLRVEATRTFIDTILTTLDDQLWRDMLTAALRYDTWKEHHLRMVLRGIDATRYDAAENIHNSSERSLILRKTREDDDRHTSDAIHHKSSRTTAHDESVHVDDDTWVSGGKKNMSSLLASSATQRLYRARDILQFCTDNGGVCGELLQDDQNCKNKNSTTDEASIHRQDTLVAAEEDKAIPVREEESRCTSHATKGERDTTGQHPIYRPQCATVHNALVRLLRACQQRYHVNNSSMQKNTNKNNSNMTSDDTYGYHNNIDHSRTDNTAISRDVANEIALLSSSGSCETSHSHSSALPALAYYRDVWSFLAWMELHDYHVQSAGVLDELELLIDKSDELSQHRSTPQKDSSTCHQTKQRQHAVAASQAINRLRYLSDERQQLLVRSAQTMHTTDTSTATRSRSSGTGDEHRLGVSTTSSNKQNALGRVPRPHPHSE